MTYSTTGIAYLILLCAAGYLIYRLFQYWEKERSSSSRQSIYFVGLFGLFALLTAIGGLFFADNPAVLIKKIEIGSFIQSFAFAAMAYHIIYLKFPKISPWLVFFPVLILGLIVSILTVTHLEFNPSLESSRAINWGFPTDSLAVYVSFTRIFLFLITFFPLAFILFSQFIKSKDSYIRGKTLGIGLALLFIITGALLDFSLINIFNLDPIWRDLIFIICGILFLSALILTLPRSDIRHLK